MIETLGCQGLKNAGSKAPMMSALIRFFNIVKIPERNNLKKERFILVHGFRGYTAVEHVAEAAPLMVARKQQ
jgi:hypothetical protein